MVPHSGVSSFRARYSCGNSDRVVLPFSGADSLVIEAYLRRTAARVSSETPPARSRVPRCRLWWQTRQHAMGMTTPMRAIHARMRSDL